MYKKIRRSMNCFSREIVYKQPSLIIYHIKPIIIKK